MQISITPSRRFGLQGSIADEMQHSVEALSDMMLCVFQRVLWALYPITHARIRHHLQHGGTDLDEHLLSTAAHSTERTAFLLLHLSSVRRRSVWQG
jgi:hypothetical protein